MKFLQWKTQTVFIEQYVYGNTQRLHDKCFVNKKKIQALKVII